MAEHLGETNNPRKELFSTSYVRILDNSPWGEPIYCEPISGELLGNV
jgi:hypothetical protein